jgi:cytochrome d ubiquinol oxidase subunit I
LRNKLSEKPWFLKLMVISLPLPYIAIECGWILAEVGRQPWIVYGLLKTSDAASPISAGQVLTTLIGFIVLYGLLGIAGFYMIFKNALKGPKDLTH